MILFKQTEFETLISKIEAKCEIICALTIVTKWHISLYQNTLQQH